MNRWWWMVLEGELPYLEERKWQVIGKHDHLFRSKFLVMMMIYEILINGLRILCLIILI